jgi:hypothetical protein
MAEQILRLESLVFSPAAKQELRDLHDAYKLVFDFFGGSKAEADLFMKSKQDFLDNKTPMSWFIKGKARELKTELVKWLSLEEV